MALQPQKRILVTGGTGFIGSRLALRCREDGHHVRVFGQTNTPSEQDNRTLIEAAGIEVMLGSVTERDDVHSAVRGMDIVIVTTAKTDDEARALLKGFEMPFSGTN